MYSTATTDATRTAEAHAETLRNMSINADQSPAALAAKLKEFLNAINRVRCSLIAAKFGSYERFEGDFGEIVAGPYKEGDFTSLERLIDPEHIAPEVESMFQATQEMKSRLLSMAHILPAEQRAELEKEITLEEFARSMRETQTELVKPLIDSGVEQQRDLLTQMLTRSGITREVFVAMVGNTEATETLLSGRLHKGIQQLEAALEVAPSEGDASAAAAASPAPAAP